MGGPLAMTYGDSFTWATRDPSWISKLAIIGLIALIPIVGGINLWGWMGACYDNMRLGVNEVPAGNFSYLGRGFPLLVVRVVYALGLAAVIVIGYVPLVILGGLTSQDHNGALALV